MNKRNLDLRKLMAAIAILAAVGFASLGIYEFIQNSHNVDQRDKYSHLVVEVRSNLRTIGGQKSRIDQLEKTLNEKGIPVPPQIVIRKTTVVVEKPKSTTTTTEPKNPNKSPEAPPKSPPESPPPKSPQTCIGNLVCVNKP